jgi:hypothetical protein
VGIVDVAFRRRARQPPSLPEIAADLEGLYALRDKAPEDPARGTMASIRESIVGVPMTLRGSGNWQPKLIPEENHWQGWMEIGRFEDQPCDANL